MSLNALRAQIEIEREAIRQRVVECALTGASPANDEAIEVSSKAILAAYVAYCRLADAK